MGRRSYWSSSQRKRLIAPSRSTGDSDAPEFFDILNFLLQFAPTHPSETKLMERFAKAGIGAGKHFDLAMFSPEQRQAIEDGIADAWNAYAKFKREEIDSGRRGSADGFGTREFLGSDYMARMASAVLGIYGNSKEEANYPAHFADSDGMPLDSATGRYTVRFEAGELPPVNSFWSLTMYELPTSLLTENAIVVI